jgi:beta-xylosidase
VSNIDPTPAYPFGHGLTYTTFTITDVRPSTATIPADGTMAIRATVTNTGAQAGVAVPQLYLSDPVATITRPVRRLTGFTRVELAPADSRTVEFVVHADLTSFTGRDPHRPRRTRPRRAHRGPRGRRSRQVRARRAGGRRPHRRPHPHDAHARPDE